MLKVLFGDHSSGGLVFVETVIDDSFGVSFDLIVEPALKTCYRFILKEPKELFLVSGYLKGCMRPLASLQMGR